MNTMNEADLQDLLLRVESAMNAEDCHGRAIYRVINRLVYGEPHGPTHTYGGVDDERRIAFLQRCLAQAKAHEHALDRLQGDLREAGEAYGYSRALAVRDAAMDLVAQLREHLGEHDPDLIVGEVVQPDEELDYGQACLATAASLRQMVGSLDTASPVEAALGAVASHLAGQLETPSPLKGIPLPTIHGRRPEHPGGCYEASFGRVHSRPSCRCPR
jgi:hypothetical protein